MNRDDINWSEYHHCENCGAKMERTIDWWWCPNCNMLHDPERDEWTFGTLELRELSRIDPARKMWYEGGEYK